MHLWQKTFREFAATEVEMSSARHEAYLGGGDKMRRENLDTPPTSARGNHPGQQTDVCSAADFGQSRSAIMSVLGKQRAGLLALLIVIAIAATLRIVLANYSLWFDEYASVFFASQPFGRLWSAWMVRETNPPLFYSILRAWTMLPGTLDGFWLRIPSIMASVLVIPVAYFGIRRHYGTKAAIAAAAMLAVSAQQIYYAQQVRAYSLLFLALSISFFGILKIAESAEHDDRVRLDGWVMYAAGSTAAIYSHTTAILWPAIASISLIIVQPKMRPILGNLWIHLVFADAIILLFASWWLYIIFLELAGANKNLSWSEYYGVRKSLVALSESTLLLRDSISWQKTLRIGVAGLAIIGIARSRKITTTRLTATCWVIAITIYIVASRKQPIIVERTTVWIALFPLVLSAVALGTIKSRWWYACSVAIIMTLFAFNLALSKSFQKENWQAAVRTVAIDKEGVMVVSGEGDAISVLNACVIALHAKGCPFEVITLKNRYNNSWAFGFAPATLATKNGLLDISPHAHVYFIQRWFERPVQDLQSVGVAKAVPVTLNFFIGPYSGIAPQLKAQSRVLNGMLTLSRGPSTPRPE